MSTVQAFENFRSNVSQLMQDRGISVRAMARDLKTSHPYVIKMLAGDYIPSLDRCEEIAEVLGVPLDKLIRKSRKK